MYKCQYKYYFFVDEEEDGDNNLSSDEGDGFVQARNERSLAFQQRKK